MDFIRAWEHPYIQFCGNRTVPCGLGHTRTISGAAPFVGPVRPVSARSGYIYYFKHDFVTFDPLGPARLLTGLLLARDRW